VITGHQNFSSFTQSFREVLMRGKDTNYVLIHFDVDKFKVFNEHYGYKVGNQLLGYVGNVVKHFLHDNEIYSRLNGDYFVILMHYQTEDELLLRLKEMKSELEDYKNKSDYRFDIIVRMGICKIDAESIAAIINEKPQSTNIVSYVNQFIDKASLARQAIKNMPLQTFYSFYQDRMIERILREKEIESEMHEALNHGDFVFYLQPKYSLKTRTIAGAEALVRWIHPGKGLIPPDSFIPLFERNGFVTEIDFYVLEQVCQKMRTWIDKNYNVVPISINLSRQHLQKDETLSRISEVVNKYAIPVNLLEFELTESAMFEKMVFLADFGQKLRKSGFSISIDDFGSGYSSLNMLKDVEVDVLKLDKAFFENENQERGNQVISKFIELSKSLHMKVVSEGVETQEQVDFLTEVGCDMVQGYYFARPMPADEFEEKYLKN
jgi:diguanylate cyclase (GGDEF)-like protein